MKTLEYLIIGLVCVIGIVFIADRAGLLPFLHSAEIVNAPSIPETVTLANVSNKLNETRAMLDGLSQRDKVYFAARTSLDLWISQAAALTNVSTFNAQDPKTQQSLKNMFSNCDTLEQMLGDGQLTQAEFDAWTHTILTRATALQQQYP